MCSVLYTASVCAAAWVTVGLRLTAALQQIIEQQMKTNDMIAERVPAVNLLSGWFPFKAIDQLYHLSIWPGKLNGGDQCYLTDYRLPTGCLGSKQRAGDEEISK